MLARCQTTRLSTDGGRSAKNNRSPPAGEAQSLFVLMRPSAGIREGSRNAIRLRFKEGKNAVKWTKLSCRTFRDNQARLQLFALAYNLANFLRRLTVPKSVSHWTLMTLREKLVKIGAKVTRHSKCVTFQLAEVAVPRALFAAILERIKRLAMPPPSVAGAYA